MKIKEYVGEESGKKTDKALRWLKGKRGDDAPTKTAKAIQRWEARLQHRHEKVWANPNGEAGCARKAEASVQRKQLPKVTGL